MGLFPKLNLLSWVSPIDTVKGEEVVRVLVKVQLNSVRYRRSTISRRRESISNNGSNGHVDSFGALDISHR